MITRRFDASRLKGSIVAAALLVAVPGWAWAQTWYPPANRMHTMMGHEGFGPIWWQTPDSLTREQAVSLAQSYLMGTRNPNLKVGEVLELTHAFEVAVRTVEGSLADKLLVDKHTGWIHSAY